MQNETISVTPWTDPMNRLLERRVRQDLVVIAKHNGRLYAAKQLGSSYLPLVLSGLSTKIETPQQEKAALKKWTDSHIHLQGQYLNVSPRLRGGIDRTIPVAMYGDAATLKGWFDQNPAKTELNLTHNELTAAEIHVLLEVLPETTVTSLILDGNAIGPDGAQALAACLPRTKLTHLSLRSCKIEERGMLALASALAHSPQLQSLNLHRNKIGIQGIAQLAAALPSSSLTELNLHRSYLNELGREGLQALYSFLKVLPHSKISILDIGLNGLGHEGAAVLAEALSDRENAGFAAQFKVCRLYNSDLGPYGAVALADAFASTGLEEIELGANRLQQRGALAFAKLLESTPLLKLGIGWNEIGDEGAEAIFKALSKSALTHLDVSGNHLGPQGAAALQGMLPHSRLVELNFGANEIGDQGAESLSKALPHCGLSCIDVQENGITPLGAEKIASVLRLCPLQRLYLQKNKIGDEGLQSLALALPSSSVKFLDVRENAIGDAGAVTLLGGATRSLLTTLYLDGNQITAEAVEQFAAFLEDPRSQLTLLHLNKNAISDEGALSLLSVLPRSKLSSLELEGNPIDVVHQATVKAQLQATKQKHRRLLQACERGDLVEVERLLGLRVAVDVRNASGDTPLHLAAGNAGLVRLLLKYNPVILRNNNNKTPIDLAETLQNVEIVSLLQQMVVVPTEYYCPITGALFSNPMVAADGHNYEKDGFNEYIASLFAGDIPRSPTHGRALANTELVLNYEFKNTISNFVELHPELYRNLHLPKEARQEFIQAMNDQNRDLVKHLLWRHRQLLFCPIGAELPIKRACGNSIELLEAIIAAYPPSMRPCVSHQLCAAAANSLGRPGLELLLDRLPKDNPFSLRAAWFEAIETSAIGYVRVLAEMGADPKARDADGITALEKARQRAHPAVMRLLDPTFVP